MRGVTAVVGAARARLRAAAWPIAQAALASGLAWFLTHDALGHPQPFFAPIAAAISLSATVGRRWRNAVQMMLGVVLGIVVAEGVVAVVGTGAVPIGAVVLLAMCVAVLFSPVPMFVNQSAASAILVLALHSGGVAGERLIDAVVGGGCALFVSLVLFPPNPLLLLGNAIRAALRGVASALSGASEALESGRPRDADSTLALTQAVHDGLGSLAAARGTARDAVRLAPLRRRYRRDVERADRRAAHVGLLANTALTLVRLAATVLDDDERPPAALTRSLDELARSTSVLARGATEEERSRVREEVGAIANMRPFYRPPAIAATGLQLRAAASDLLRVIRDQDEAAAWQRAVRLRSAVRDSRPAAAARSRTAALRRR
jgi:uncharacterized membrane protein YgaE (UPF0421/DUF939 family)